MELLGSRQTKRKFLVNGCSMCIEKQRVFRPAVFYFWVPRLRGDDIVGCAQLSRNERSFPPSLKLRRDKS